MTRHQQFLLAAALAFAESRIDEINDTLGEEDMDLIIYEGQGYAKAQEGDFKELYELLKNK